MTLIAREPLATPSTWLGPELLRSDDWVRRLTPGQVTDLENALAVAKATGEPMTDLTPLLYEPFYWDHNDEQSEGEDPEEQRRPPRPHRVRGLRRARAKAPPRTRLRRCF